jgi:hypothetical protein
MKVPKVKRAHFLDYGDAQRYQQQTEAVRNDFVDLRSLTTAKPEAGSK